MMMGKNPLASKPSFGLSIDLDFHDINVKHVARHRFDTVKDFLHDEFPVVRGSYEECAEVGAHNHFDCATSHVKNHDLVLVCADGAAVFAHRLYLAVFSDLIRALLRQRACHGCGKSQEDDQTVIVLDGVDLGTVCSLMEVVYTGRTYLKGQEEADALVALAKELRMNFGGSQVSLVKLSTTKKVSENVRDPFKSLKFRPVAEVIDHLRRLSPLPADFVQQVRRRQKENVQPVSPPKRKRKIGPKSKMRSLSNSVGDEVENGLEGKRPRLEESGYLSIAEDQDIVELEHEQDVFDLYDDVAPEESEQLTNGIGDEPSELVNEQVNVSNEHPNGNDAYMDDVQDEVFNSVDEEGTESEKDPEPKIASSTSTKGKALEKDPFEFTDEDTSNDTAKQVIASKIDESKEIGKAKGEKKLKLKDPYEFTEDDATSKIVQLKKRIARAKGAENDKIAASDDEDEMLGNDVIGNLAASPPNDGMSFNDTMMSLNNDLDEWN